MGRDRDRPWRPVAGLILTSSLLVAGCNWFAPAKPATVETETPASTADTPVESTVKATPAVTARGRSATDGTKSRKPSQRRGATAPDASPADGAVVATPSAPETPAPLASRSGDTTPTGAPVVAGSRPALSLEERSAIYSKADTDVIPARLLTVQNGGATFRNMKMDVNTMELVISKQGRVEQVKLITPVKRMTDMLLLSGAKTWRFSPALKNGQPVRYRTQYSWQTTP